MPIIRSRIKIDAVKVVVMKQAKELEKTYFVILEKLKDPYYARIIFGVPAILVLLFSISSYLDWGWKPVGVIVGLYLLIKGFGIEESIFSIGREFRFSIEKTSWLAYISAFALLLVSFWAAQEAYSEALGLGLDGGKTVAYVLKSLLFLFPWVFLLIIGGKTIDAMTENKKFIITRYSLYAVAVLLTAMILSIGAQWVLNIEEPYVSFGDFLSAIIIGLVIGYAAIMIIGMVRKSSVLSMKLDGKDVINENGNFLGKVLGVDAKKEQLVLQNQLGRKFNLSFRHIYSIEDSVFVKSV
jgi:putative membrane protein